MYNSELATFSTRKLLRNDRDHPHKLREKLRAANRESVRYPFINLIVARRSPYVVTIMR